MVQGTVPGQAWIRCRALGFGPAQFQQRQLLGGLNLRPFVKVLHTSKAVRPRTLRKALPMPFDTSRAALIEDFLLHGAITRHEGIFAS